MVVSKQNNRPGLVDTHSVTQSFRSLNEPLIIETNAIFVHAVLINDLNQHCKYFLPAMQMHAKNKPCLLFTTGLKN